MLWWLTRVDTHTGQPLLETLLKCMNCFFMSALFTEPDNKGREEIALREGRWEGVKRRARESSADGT